MRGFVWEFLRICRADAARARKGKDIQAGLQQFEDLMEASSVATTASRPILLYYALSQAGKALIASRSRQAANGHGLTVAIEDKNLLHTTVQPHGKQGEFQVVSEVTGSPALGCAVSLGALAASLPEMAGIFMDDDWPHALQVHIDHGASLTDPIPDHWWVDVQWPQGIPATLDDVAKTLRGYSWVGTRIGDVTHPKVVTRNDRNRQLEWRGTVIPLKAGASEIESAIPEYRIQGRRWIRPMLDSGQDMPSPLMTWWALLYALSHFARYRPTKWVAAIDVNKCDAAPTIERIMDRAMTALPHLVLEALVPAPVMIPFAVPDTEPFSFVPQE